MPKVSVIIPVYNVERYLEHCLNSVLSQTLTDIEIICVNDKSPDSSQQILYTFAAADNRFVLKKHNRNRGLPAARNTGFDTAKGDFIFFLDSDDYLECEDALETLYKTAVTDNADEVIGGVLKWNEETGEKYYGWHKTYLEKEVHQKTLDELPQLYANVVAWNKMLRRSFLLQHNIRFNEDITKHEDNPFSCQVHILAQNISILKKITYIYRQVANGSLMSTIDKKDAWYRYKYCHDIFKFIESDTDHQRYRKMYYHRYSRQLIEGAAILSRFCPSKEEIKTLLNQWKRIVLLLPSELPGIPAGHRNIYRDILKGAYSQAWEKAINLLIPKHTNIATGTPVINGNTLDLKKKLDRQKRLNTKLRSQIEIVFRSRSWRITAPIRKLLFKIRGY